MECSVCHRRTTTSLNVSVRDYSGPGPHPVNGCLGKWKSVILGFCNRHESDVRKKAENMGHLVR